MIIFYKLFHDQKFYEQFFIKSFWNSISFIKYLDQTCRKPGSWIHIHTCQGSDSYLSGVRFILVRSLIHTWQTSYPYLTQPVVHVWIKYERFNLKYIRGVPTEGLMKCIYHLPSLRGKWIVYTVPAGLIKCVYHPYGANEMYLLFMRDQWSVFTVLTGLMKYVSSLRD